jgi:hypothetical protein
MPRYHYGTVPALAWLLNHYFYGGLHYSWLAEEFHPFLTNPKSSNPYLIYGDLHWGVAKVDPYDKFLAQSRHGLARGVVARKTAGIADPVLSRKLRRICAKAAVEMFYPLVYRVDVGQISPSRAVLAGSAASGSREILVPDLRETEFELLFADFRDPDLQRLILDEMSGASRTSPVDALRTLERRMLS